MNTNDTLASDPWTTNYVLAPPGPVIARRRSLRGAGDVERRVLFVSYAFPPTGGGGVQRAAKFAKYLPHFGWRPTILTVANPSVPVQDYDLAEDLDPRLSIVRARTWEPGYGVKKQLARAGSAGRATVGSLLRRLSMQVLQPDPQILWNPSAFRAAAGVLRTQAHDAILVTGPPFSSFLLGRKLKNRFGIPLVLDFRDEWMLVAQHLENYQLSGFAYRWQHAMMRRVLRAADAVIATTRASAVELGGYCYEAKSTATATCIYNGFDPDDLSAVGRESSASPRLRIVYTGTLWKLTNIAPLVRALQALAQIAPARTADVELVVAGRRTPQQDTVLEGLRTTGVSVVRHDYLPHRKSLELAATADILLLLLDDQPGAERVVPAKLFEYLALAKPILAIGPDGETRELLRHHSHAIAFRPAETERLTRWLKAQLDIVSKPRMPQSANSNSTASPMLLARFSRPSLTGELAHLLERCIMADQYPAS
jgi:glycosyltransferase involved in cell wall biosynthesis